MFPVTLPGLVALRNSVCASAPDFKCFTVARRV